MLAGAVESSSFFVTNLASRLPLRERPLTFSSPILNWEVRVLLLCRAGAGKVPGLRAESECDRDIRVVDGGMSELRDDDGKVFLASTRILAYSVA